MISQQGNGRLCKGCGQAPKWFYARGLCKACWSNKEVRLACGCLDYGAASRSGLGQVLFGEVLPGTNLKGWCPTTATPGSDEKIMVLEQRVLLKQPLWHPLDGPLDVEDAMRRDRMARRMFKIKGGE